MRVLLVNENIGGHATVHANLRRELQGHPECEAEFVDLPAPGLLRRIAGASLPLLSHHDLDLQPLRAQLAHSLIGRRAVQSRVGSFDVVGVYTHNAALLSSGVMRRHPSVVSLDTTNARNAFRIPQRRPTVWTERLLPLTKLFEQRVYDSSTLIACHSEWAADSLRSDYGVPPGKIRVVRFGVPLPPPSPPRIEKRVPTLIFVGRQMERKGGWRLLDLYRRELRDRARVVFVTEEPVLPEAGVTIVNDVRPGDGRLGALLADADIFVFPSEVDQAPNAVIEAMAAGLPVIAFDSGAVGEMVGHDVGGLVVPVDNGALAEAVRRLIGEPATRRRLGAGARARAEEYFDVRRTTADFVAVLKEATEIWQPPGRRSCSV